jgi:hypothetical protein
MSAVLLRSWARAPSGGNSAAGVGGGTSHASGASRWRRQQQACLGRLAVEPPRGRCQLQVPDPRPAAGQGGGFVWQPGAGAAGHGEAAEGRAPQCGDDRRQHHLVRCSPPARDVSQLVPRSNPCLSRTPRRAGLWSRRAAAGAAAAVSSHIHASAMGLLAGVRGLTQTHPTQQTPSPGSTKRSPTPPTTSKTAQSPPCPAGEAWQAHSACLGRQRLLWLPWWPDCTMWGRSLTGLSPPPCCLAATLHCVLTGTFKRMWTLYLWRWAAGSTEQGQGRAWEIGRAGQGCTAA